MRSLLVRRIKELTRQPGGPPRRVRSEEELSLCAEIIALRAELDTREKQSKTRDKRIQFTVKHMLERARKKAKKKARMK
jgi:hypothetical protein